MSRSARVLLHLLAFAAGWILVQGIVESMAGPAFAWLSRVLGEPVPMFPFSMLAGAVGGSWIGFNLLEVASARDRATVSGYPSWSRPGFFVRLGAGRSAWQLRRLLQGATLGAVAMLVTALLLWLPGWLRFEPSGAFDSMVGDTWGAVAWRLLVVLAPAALWEEVVFRGYLFTVASEAAGLQVARISTSVVFGLVHVMNPGATLLTTSIVMLAGWCLAQVRELMGLPSAWLAHLAWNWVMAAVLHVAVSGQPFNAPGYRAVADGPAWISGGSWGPEGGLIAALVLAVGAWGGWHVTHRREAKTAVAAGA